MFRLFSTPFIVDIIQRSFLSKHIDIVILPTKTRLLRLLYRASLFLFMSYKAVPLLQQTSQRTQR